MVFEVGVIREWEWASGTGVGRSLSMVREMEMEARERNKVEMVRILWGWKWVEVRRVGSGLDGGRRGLGVGMVEAEVECVPDDTRSTKLVQDSRERPR